MSADAARGWAVLALAVFGPSGQPPAWWAQAACSGVPTEVFFGHPSKASALLCEGCPVRAECAEDQLAWEAQSSTGRGTSAGLFGGLTGKQRRLIHKPIESNQDSSPVLFELGAA